MDSFKTDKILFNVKLSKYLGLLQVLDLESFKFKGYNVYRMVCMLFILFVSTISSILFVNGLFYWSNHKTQALYYFAFLESYIFVIYKIIILVIKSKEIKEISLITRFDFMSNSSLRDETLLNLWRNRIIQITSGYALLFFLCAILFTMSSMLFNHGTNTMKTYYGSTGDYRINILNLYAPFSADTYNTYFNIMYFVEASNVFMLLIILIMFDTLLITFVMAFSCQLEMVNLAFESTGLKCVTENRIINNGGDENKSSVHLYTDYKMYNDLISIIKEHQAILKNLDTFYSVFKNVLLSQLFVSSFSIIVLWFNLIMVFIDGKIDDKTKASLINMAVSVSVEIFQVFMSCYLSEFLYTKKESVNFALYSSNWTEMDLRCKKLILLTMYMNNAHKQKLKYSQMKIVNLELFFGTMRICYSVVSMMLNSR